MFGMGTGVTPPIRPPETYDLVKAASRRAGCRGHAAGGREALRELNRKVSGGSGRALEGLIIGCSGGLRCDEQTGRQASGLLVLVS